MAKKVTFTLDDETIVRLNATSTRLQKAKSEVVREAVAEYAARAGRLSERERLRKLTVLDSLMPSVPRRSARAVDQEIAGLRKERKSGGRGGAKGRK